MKYILITFLLLLSTPSFSCPGVGDWNMERPMRNSMMKNWMNNPKMSKSQKRGWMGCQMSMVRHHYYMQNGLPSKYAGLSNPLKASDKAISMGKKVYKNNCMVCQGKNGLGNGEAAKDLNPSPTNIARFAKMPMANDSYLFWTVSEGGERLETAMPSFKDSLSKDEIWSVIHYLRNM